MSCTCARIPSPPVFLHVILINWEWPRNEATHCSLYDHSCACALTNTFVHFFTTTKVWHRSSYFLRFACMQNIDCMYVLGGAPATSWLHLNNYVTVHNKTNHYCNGSPCEVWAIIVTQSNHMCISITFLAWIDSGITPFCFVTSKTLYLWIKEVNSIATLSIHDAELLP